MVCQPLELPEKMRQVLHKSTIAMLPDSLPLERVWARDYGGSNVASEASYWCNRRETSEIQARAYTRHSYAHAQYTACAVYSLSIAIVCMEGPWHLLFNMRQCMVYMNSADTLVLSLESVLQSGIHDNFLHSISTGQYDAHTHS